MVTVTVGTPYRGQAVQAPASFSISGLNLTKAWGAQPASAEVTYHPSTTGNESIAIGGVAAGASITIAAPGHTFYGIVMRDNVRQASRGKSRTLSANDLREILKWDQVFGAFNMPESRLVYVSGRWVRRRRWRHTLPATFNARHQTWTDSPYTAAQLATLILGAPTVYAPWAATYHADMNVVPVTSLDCMQGMKLADALVQIADRLGLVFTFDGISGGFWQLRFARKGYGTFPLPVDITGRVQWELTTATDDTEEGVSLTEAPTHIRVLGSRNVWQLLNVTLTPDWASAWQTFLDDGQFYDYVFRNFRDSTGTLYSARVDAGDTEKIIARQMAVERAHRLTVGEFAAVAGSSYLDERLWAGRSRADLPALLYLRQVVWRCYRLPDLVNVGGASVPVTDLQVMDRTIAELSHDPATGIMSVTMDGSIPRGTEDRGYAVAQGFNLDQDYLSALRPDQIDVSTWNTGQDQWTRVDFQVQEAGDGQSVLVFDQPLVRVTNLLLNVDGWAVPNAAATTSVVTVRASVAVAAEHFRYDYGDRVVGIENGPVRVLTESGLRDEWVFNTLAGVSGGNPLPLPYADGQTATQKAVAMLNAERVGASLVRSGGYRRYLQIGDVGTSLTGMIDRVELEYSPRGLSESVTFTLERGFLSFQPERDYERRATLATLAPGQAELRQTADEHARLISALRGNGLALREFYRHWKGLNQTALSTVWVTGGTGTLPVGTPLWKKASVNTGGRLSDAQPALPTAVTTGHAVFAGVTVRKDENAQRPLNVATNGRVLARVQGPAAPGDPLGRAPIAGGTAQDFLVKATDSSPVVGQARQTVASGITALVEVMLGGVGGGSGGGALPVFL
ncbi:MAG: hypothetical protein ACYDC1_22820 [Limisphaerales bacterium]